MKENLLWRQALRREAEQNTAIQQSLISASSQSFLFWCNAFVWTYRQKIVGEDGNEIPITGNAAHIPFITWPIQDESADIVIQSIFSGVDVNLEKSRDMGATWLLLSIATWFFVFMKSVNIGAVSRKEQLVDKPGDMDSLFEKIRYILKHLPHWMNPPVKDTYMFLYNKQRDSSVAGESTNTDVGRGGRKTFYIVDEAAAIRHADEVESSLSANCACQIWASTPKGPLTQFHKRIIEKRGLIVQLPWYRHPEKSIKARQIVDLQGRVKWTSPWYEQLPKKFSAKTIAQEVDMDHGQSGDMFFDFTELQRHKQDHAMHPMTAGEIRWIGELTEEKKIALIQQFNYEKTIFIKSEKKKKWRFWFEPDNGRPPQHWTYVAGVDISNGAGGSNSVITVIAVEIGQVVAKFWDAYISPEELAMEFAKASIWFGGISQPMFSIWENNGPGGIFGRKLVASIGYSSYYRQKAVNSKKKKMSPRWGWHSARESKEILLGIYRDALGSDRIINPCEESLDEAADYIYDDTGAIIPAKLREESSGGRQLHGDHVIADAVATMAALEIPESEKRKGKPPIGSYLWRRDNRINGNLRNDPWR